MIFLHLYQKNLLIIYLKHNQICHQKNHQFLICNYQTACLNRIWKSWKHCKFVIWINNCKGSSFGLCYLAKKRRLDSFNSIETGEVLNFVIKSLVCHMFMFVVLILGLVLYLVFQLRLVLRLQPMAYQLYTKEIKYNKIAMKAQLLWSKIAEKRWRTQKQRNYTLSR